MRAAARTLGVCAGLILAGCFGDGAGPGSGRASFQLAANIESGALRVVDVNRVVIRLAKPVTSAIVLEKIVDFPATTDTLDLSLDVPIEGVAELFELTLLMIDDPAGDTVFRSGPTLILATAGPASAIIPTIPVYVGPGANAVAIRFVAAVPSLLFGLSAQFTAQALDANNQVVPGAPIIYSSSNPGLAVVDPVTGAVTALGVRGNVTVTASLLRTSATTAPAAVSLPLTVLPVPSALVLLSGGGQTGVIGGLLGQPVRVRVIAFDGLGVEGVRVNFSVLSGGGLLSAASAVTDAQGEASVAWTLGLLPGGQLLSATVPGLAGGMVNVSATGILVQEDGRSTSFSVPWPSS